jgi:hypothetical protein
LGTLLIAFFWFTGLMTSKASLALLGGYWEFLGVFTLIANVLFHHWALYRLQNRSGLLEQEKVADWVRRLPR